MTGPCLCGDPCCARCFPGGQGMAQLEAALDAIYDILAEQECQEDIDAFILGGKAALAVRNGKAEEITLTQDSLATLEIPGEVPWPPEDGTCGWDGCEGSLDRKPGHRAHPDEPGEADAWECDTCGHIYSCDHHGNPDYFENY